jgi:hypothetical protein
MFSVAIQFISAKYCPFHGGCGKSDAVAFGGEIGRRDAKLVLEYKWYKLDMEIP